MSEETTICPWCMTEIVWDEEIGPESVCPHCENELTGYRTLSLGAEEEEDEELKEEDIVAHAEALNNGDDDNDDGFRHTDARMLALQDKVDRITDAQEEAPECPSCRSFMLEIGRGQAGGKDYEPVVPEALGKPLLPGPFGIVWFVCPTCFHTEQRLSEEDRMVMLRRLAASD